QAGGTSHYDAERVAGTLVEEINPNVAHLAVSTKEAVGFQSRGGLTVHDYLTYPLTGQREGLPVVVLVHDGPHRRDAMDFDAEAQFLANRGYLVFQLNYRGSAGYGKKFWAAGFKEWGGKIQADMIDGVT